MYVKKAAKTTFVWKARTFKVDEIDTWAGVDFTNILHADPETAKNTVKLRFLNLRL